MPLPVESLDKLAEPTTSRVNGASPNNAHSFPTENSTDSGISYLNEDNMDVNHANHKHSDTEEDSEMEDDEEEDNIEMEEEASAQDKHKDEGLSKEHTATLDRLKQSQRDR